MPPKVSERLKLQVYTTAGTLSGELLVPEVDGGQSSFRLIDIFNNPRLSSLLYETAMDALVVEDVVFDDGSQSESLYLLRHQIVCAHLRGQYETFDEAAKQRVRKSKAPIYETKTLIASSPFRKERLTVRLTNGAVVSGVYYRGLSDLCRRSVKTEFIILSDANAQFPGETAMLLTFLVVNYEHIVSFI